MKKGILVFTDDKTLKHKKLDGREDEGEYCFWETNKIPKEFVETLNLSKSPRVSFEQSSYAILKEFPIYIAIKGKVKGYFIIHDVEDGDEHDCWLIFYSESFVEIKDGEQLKPSQGWRYYPKKDASSERGEQK